MSAYSLIPSDQGRACSVISAIVLAPDSRLDDNLDQAREIVVRSLVWLVSAVVSGVVRDVVLAIPPGLGLSEVASQSGCELVDAESEADRIAEAVAAARESQLFILRTGYHPDNGLIGEVESFIRRLPPDSTAKLLAAPETFMQRLFPNTAPVVGVLVPRALAEKRTSFERLARGARRGARLHTRARRVV